MQYFKQSIESNLCLLKYKVIFALIGLFLLPFYSQNVTFVISFPPLPQGFSYSGLLGVGMAMSGIPGLGMNFVANVVLKSDQIK